MEQDFDFKSFFRHTHNSEKDPSFSKISYFQHDYQDGENFIPYRMTIKYNELKQYIYIAKHIYLQHNFKKKKNNLKQSGGYYGTR